MIKDTDCVLSMPLVNGRRELWFPFAGLIHTFMYMLHPPMISKSDKPLVIVDVGACVGAFTVAMRECLTHSTYHLFEPRTECYPYLENNVGDIENVHIYDYALSDKDGIAQMSYPEQYVRMGNASMYGGGIESYTVRTRRLDDVITGPVHLIKIDVEGAELDVLHGAERILREYKPAIYVELKDVHQARAGRTSDDVAHYIMDLGYGEPMRLVQNDYLFTGKA